MSWIVAAVLCILIAAYTLALLSATPLQADGEDE